MTQDKLTPPEGFKITYLGHNTAIFTEEKTDDDLRWEAAMEVLDEMFDRIREIDRRLGRLEKKK